MPLWDQVKKQFLDVVEWLEQDDATLAWRFPIQDNEIQSGGRLVVRESQIALFVDEGRIADSFRAGTWPLTTQNLPILATLKAWKFGFDSPFKSEVYFFSARQKLGQRWGTPQPITVRDREMGSLQLRMFGTFAYHLVNEKLFYKELSGTRDRFTTEDLAVQAVPVVTATAAAAFGQSGVPFLDVAANQLALSQELQKRLAEPFARWGMALDSFVVESVTLPAELQDALTRRQSMGILGDLSRYAQYEAARSIPIAAGNEGGIAGIGAGLAAGATIGQVMGGALAGSAGGPRPASAGGAPGAASGGPAQQDGGAAPAAVACAACGKAVGAADPFCRFCGAARQRACPSCSAPAATDAAFCARCGTKLP